MSVGPSELWRPEVNETPRYDLSPTEMHVATIATLASMGDLPPGRFVTTLAEGELMNVGRTVERIVFEDTFGNTGDLMKGEYGEYDKANSRRFLITLDTEKQQPAGVFGIITNSEAGLKSVNDASRPEYLNLPAELILRQEGITDPDKCWDAGTLAVLPEYRGWRTGLEVSTMLYRSFFLYGDQQGVEDVVAIIDKGAWRNVKAIGLPFHVIAGSGPFEYLGSTDSRAVHGKFGEFFGAVNKRAKALSRMATVGSAITRFTGIETKGMKKLKTASQAVGRLATGKDLDERIVLPA